MNLNNKGYTLIEMLIVILMIAVISIVSAEFILGLFSATVKSHNKILVEQDYTFMNLKISKMIQDATSISLEGDAPQILNIDLAGQVYTLKYQNENILLNNEVLNSIPIKNYVIELKNENNPQQISIKFDIEKDPDNPRLSAKQTFDRIITVTKSYR